MPDGNLIEKSQRFSVLKTKRQIPQTLGILFSNLERVGKTKYMLLISLFLVLFANG